MRAPTYLMHASSAGKAHAEACRPGLDPLGPCVGAHAGAYDVQDVQEALAANGFAGTLDPGPLFNEPAAALLNSAYYHHY